MSSSAVPGKSSSEGWPRRRTPAKGVGDPKVSVSHRIAEGLLLMSLILAPKSSKELLKQHTQEASSSPPYSSMRSALPTSLPSIS